MHLVRQILPTRREGERLEKRHAQSLGDTEYNRRSEEGAAPIWPEAWRREDGEGRQSNGWKDEECCGNQPGPRVGVRHAHDAAEHKCCSTTDWRERKEEVGSNVLAWEACHGPPCDKEDIKKATGATNDLAKHQKAVGWV